MKRLIIYLFIVGCSVVAHAQKAYLCGDGVAVFYPAGFSEQQMLPSFIIKDESSMMKVAELPEGWAVTPEFSNEGGKNVIRISYGNADLYGNGLVKGNLLRNGTEVTLWNTDNYAYAGYDGKQLYQSHPWVMGVRADGSSFGIIVDNTWRQTFKLGNPIEVVSDGPSARVVVIEKDSPADVLTELGRISGTMEMPPLWALGHQQCRYSYYPESRVKEIADEFRNRSIPCDVIWMDIDYMDGFRVFTFDSSRFPYPKGLGDYLHGKDFKAVYMIDPGIKKDDGYFVYKSGTDGDHWVKDKDGNTFVGSVWPGDCVFPDFTRPQTREWWGGLYKDFMANGVDGVWNDMNEPSVFGGNEQTMPADNVHRGGDGIPQGPHSRYHNVYGYLMVKASREGMLAANPDKRPFVLSRANFLGGQCYAATWTGDNQSTWEHLKMSVPMSLSLSLSGQPFNGPDIGGFSLDATADLFGHWIALGAYYPFSRNHASGETANQEPWAFGQRIEDVARTALNRRYRLLPYLYTLFHEASASGMPVMRPVFMSDIHDLSLRSEQQAFMLGGDLLVIPRWSYKPNLPQGDWDVLRLEDDADDGYQPLVALRQGAIVPLGELVQSTVSYSDDRITLLVNPSENGMAEGLLYSDSGDGFGYKNGEYSVTRFSSVEENGRLKVTISDAEGESAAKRSYRIGYVTDNNIVYSAWFTGTEHVVDMIPDTQDGIDLSPVSKMYVGASFCGFSPGEIPMAQVARNEWVSHSVLVPAGRQEIKFADEISWSGDDWGNAEGFEGVASLTTGGGANIGFDVEQEGYYVFRFNSGTLEYSIEPSFAFDNKSMFVTGTFNDWKVYWHEMELVGDHQWKTTVYIPAGSHEMKFANDENWGGSDWGDAVGMSGVAKEATGGNPNIRFEVEESGRYDIEFNESTLVYSVVRSGDGGTVSISISDGSIGVAVYPNPADSYIRVVSGFGMDKVSLHAMDGMEILSQHVAGNCCSVDVSSITHGLYLLRVAGTDGGSCIRKVMVR